jgi:hypothetical protein
MKRLLAVALYTGLLSGAALAASPWDGTYTFEQPIGPGAGGMQLFVTHTLIIGPPNGCTIVAQGYQTNEQLRCKATPNGDRLDVAFVSHADGKLVNVHNVKIYEPNQKLFTLGRKGNAITTQWAGYSMNKTVGAAPGDDTFKKTGDQAQMPKR